MTGWPHFLHGTVLNGGIFPGINAVLSHHPHLTIRNCSLMACETNLTPRANPTTHFFFAKGARAVHGLLEFKLQLVFQRTG